MKNRVSFYTLGCRLNQSETAVLERSFEVKGYRVVGFDEPADIVVVNTCTVTENGDADTRRIVNKINRINPKARIALIGCQAQTQKEKLLDLPNVHFVVGNARKMDLVEILFEMSKQPDRVGRGTVITPTIPRDAFTIPIAGIDRHHTRANIKIQDGCDFFCSFCEIPYARGRARSRVFEDILLEARALAAAGHKELVLTGINLGTYNHEGKTIVDVIDSLESIAELKRIRISSIEPTTIPWEIIHKMNVEAQNSEPLLCRYLHIPLQSGSNHVLQLMQRKYTVEEYSNFINQIYQSVPQVGLGTDVIVGFPGETDADFQQTYELLRELPLAYFHVFSYSQRTMAKSQNLPDAVPAKIIAQRSETLRQLSVRKRILFLQSLIGTKQHVLIEEHKNGFWFGKTDHFAAIKIRSNKNLSNQIIAVELKTIDGQTIIGCLG